MCGAGSKKAHAGPLVNAPVDQQPAMRSKWHKRTRAARSQPRAFRAMTSTRTSAPKTHTHTPSRGSRAMGRGGAAPAPAPALAATGSITDRTPRTTQVDLEAKQVSFLSHLEPKYVGDVLCKALPAMRPALQQVSNARLCLVVTQLAEKSLLHHVLVAFREHG